MDLRCALRLPLAAASVLTDFDATLSFGNAMPLFEADISDSEDGEDEALGYGSSRVSWIQTDHYIYKIPGQQ